MSHTFTVASLAVIAARLASISTVLEFA
jgi:hypothetical protein